MQDTDRCSALRLEAWDADHRARAEPLPMITRGTPETPTRSGTEIMAAATRPVEDVLGGLGVTGDDGKERCAHSPDRV